jgi:secondary thiamine-phosphate synthase enzyme
MSGWQQQELRITTRGRGFYPLTAELESLVSNSGIQTGMCHCFVRHTSASLIITENADPDVLRDLEQYFSRQVPDGDPAHLHDAEGPDDMPAHIRSMWTGCSHGVPVVQGRLALGTWQGMFLWEHRSAPHERRVLVSLSG